MPQEPYLLDTNILVRLVRRDELGQEIIARYDLYMTEAQPAYCVVTEGEIRSLSYQWKWGTAKIDAMRFALDYFVRLPIESAAVIEAYARIDSYCKARGITMGKNDLWISAVAHVTGFTLLTADHDFDALYPVFLTRELVELNTEEDMPPSAGNETETRD
jgi:predicted nucleic acid-binding protein